MNTSEFSELLSEVRTMIRESVKLYTDYTDLDETQFLVIRQLIYYMLIDLIGEIGLDLTTSEKIQAEKIYRTCALSEAPCNDKDIH